MSLRTITVVQWLIHEGDKYHLHYSFAREDWTIINAFDELLLDKPAASIHAARLAASPHFSMYLYDQQVGNINAISPINRRSTLENVFKDESVKYKFPRIFVDNRPFAQFDRAIFNVVVATPPAPPAPQATQSEAKPPPAKRSFKGMEAKALTAGKVDEKEDDDNDEEGEEGKGPTKRQKLAASAMPPPPRPAPASAPGNNTRSCKWENCTRSFADGEALYQHACDDHIGTKEKGNLCLKCRWDNCKREASTKRDHMTSHLLSHMKEGENTLRRVKCRHGCGKLFSRTQDRNKHEKGRHGAVFGK